MGHQEAAAQQNATTHSHTFPPLGTAIAVTPENRAEALRGTPIFFRLACNIAARIQIGSITFQLPDGRALAFNGVEEPETRALIQISDFDFARRVIFGGDSGFFESFADGQWDTPDLSTCLYVLARNADHINRAFEGTTLIRWIERARHAMNRNTKVGAKRNIMAHYDLGNAFYEKWLDKTMTYSSARFHSQTENLADAQTNKYRALAHSIGLKPDEHVLEIGAGWGGFAEFAAKEVGAKVTGLTISAAQYDYASERIFRAGLNERVSLRLQDYRDEAGAYDKIASIEMFEAVGKAYWPQYFSKVRECLAPGGVAGLQIITIADRFFDRYLKSPDFIQRYVFPGGMLPSPSQLKTHINGAGLTWKDTNAFGEDYARTLAEWRERFLGAWDDIAQMGYSERFKKLWRFYLAYCEAGFRARTTDVVQVSLTR
ncbi:MAG: cyclopropane-fatty-acyl-phospholipid synthase family protein [Pseudomonadota bacterium]